MYESDELEMWDEPHTYQCEECGKGLDYEQIYEDVGHEYLCGNCLLMLHKKDLW